MKIFIKRNAEKLVEKLGIDKWPVWESPVNKFDWTYSDYETCYFIEGRVVIHTFEGDYEINKGDIAFFTKGLSCQWEVKEPVKKFYSFLDLSDKI